MRLMGGCNRRMQQEARRTARRAKPAWTEEQRAMFKSIGRQGAPYTSGCFCCGNSKATNGPEDGKGERGEDWLGDTPEMTKPKKL